MQNYRHKEKMNNLWPLILLPLFIACGDKEEDTAEDTADTSSEVEAADPSAE